MLELQKYVGKDIGLYAGIISYIANNKEQDYLLVLLVILQIIKKLE